ncbi:hypothetical protein QM480_04130 [Flectobacillus sp. DC10W]|uniref:Uncharacterized protein n=1 Tax=Flectobacillus longus TaxID=2984207 RepID=A0ABT6YIS6_9BACT|nr:hypothetical protein [Flectobacillus longus]MDI9863497.1 hypothetical protein [Flectobacillus longus]
MKILAVENGQTVAKDSTDNIVKNQIKQDLGLDKVSNVPDSQKEVSVPTQNAIAVAINNSENAKPLGVYDASTNTPSLNSTPSNLLKDGDYYDIIVEGPSTFSGINFQTGSLLRKNDRLVKFGTFWYIRPFDSNYVAKGELDFFTKTQLSSSKGDYLEGTANISSDQISVKNGYSGNGTYLIKSFTKNTFGYKTGDKLTFIAIINELSAGSASNKLSFGANRVTNGVTVSNVHQNRVVERISTNIIKIKFDVTVVSENDSKFDIFLQINGLTNSSGEDWVYTWKSLYYQNSSTLFEINRLTFLFEKSLKNESDILSNNGNINTLLLSDYYNKIIEKGTPVGNGGEERFGGKYFEDNAIKVDANNTGSQAYRYFPFNNYQTTFGKKTGDTLKIYALLDVSDSTLLWSASAQITRNNSLNTNALINKKITPIGGDKYIFEGDMLILNSDENSTSFRFYVQISSQNQAVNTDRIIRVISFGIGSSDLRISSLFEIIKQRIQDDYVNKTAFSEAFLLRKTVTLPLTGENLGGAQFRNQNKTIAVPIGQTGHMAYFNYDTLLLFPDFNTRYNLKKLKFQFLLKITGKLNGTLVAFANGITTSANSSFELVKSNSETENYYKVGFEVDVTSSLSTIKPALQLRNATTLYTEELLIDFQEIVYSVVKSNSNTPSLITQFENDIKEQIESTVSKTSVAKTTQLIVRKNGTVGTDCDFAGNRAIQDAIEFCTDATSTKKYEILVYEGIYEANDPAQYNSGGIVTGMVSFIRGRNYVSVRGVDMERCIIRGLLPENLNSGNYQNYQLVYWHSDNGTMENFTVDFGNGRYPIHIDGGRTGCKNFLSNLFRIKVIHRGNKGNALAWTSYHPIGLGTSDGQQLIHKDSMFISKGNALYAHNNRAFDKECGLEYYNCIFETDSNSKIIATIQSMGSGRRDKIRLENCQFQGGYIIDHNNEPFLTANLTETYYDTADFRLYGSGNSPFLYEPALRGIALRIKSKSKGTNSKVRIDPTCSAFDLIIKDNKYIGDYVDYFGVSIQSGYAFRDGDNGLSGFAIGRLDVGEEGITINKNLYVKSLAKRLGDCSTNNKTLTVTIDTLTYNIVFNKNYTGVGVTETMLPAFTNQQIVDEIKAVIGNVADVDLWGVGNDYYPEFTDVLSIQKSTEVIFKGMAVVVDGGLARKAKNTDEKIFGIALDDFLTGGKGRILMKGYIRTDETKRFSTLQENYTVVNKGEQLGISSTDGKLSKLSQRKFFTAIDNGIVAFNL